MPEPSPRSRELRERLLAFFDRHLDPNEALFHAPHGHAEIRFEDVRVPA